MAIFIAVACCKAKPESVNCVIERGRQRAAREAARMPTEARDGKINRREVRALAKK